MSALGLTPEQHRMRRSFIGGSDAGAIVAGGEEWLKLWLQKTGRAEPDNLSDVLPVQMGLFTEPFNLFWYWKNTGRAVERRGAQVRHPSLSYLGCTLDGATTTSHGYPAPINAKHVGKAGEQLIIRYTAQGTHEALVLGCDWFILSTFIGNSRWELTECEVDPFFLQDYLQKCRDFWAFVETDIEPPTVEPLLVPVPSKLRTVHLDSSSEMWPNWGSEMIEQLAIWLGTLPAFKDHEAAKAAIKQILPEDVGTVLRDRIKVVRDKAGSVRISLTKEKSGD